MLHPLQVPSALIPSILALCALVSACGGGDTASDEAYAPGIAATVSTDSAVAASFIEPSTLASDTSNATALIDDPVYGPTTHSLADLNAALVTSADNSALGVQLVVDPDPGAAANSGPTMTILAATGATIQYQRVVYVDQANPNASNLNEGSLARPLKTIGAALRQLRPGDDVVVRPGIYREALVFPSRAWGSAKTRLRAETARTVVVKGSIQLTGWKPEGNDVYSVAWPGVAPSQVFRGGALLTQIAGTIFSGYPLLAGHQYNSLHASQGGIWPGRINGSLATMTVNSFFYDAAAKKLFVRLSTTPAAQEALEVSTAHFVLQAMSISGVTIEGLDFEHANTSYYWNNGALLVSGSGNTLKNLSVRLMDAACVQITGGSDNALVDSSIHDCGQLGLKADGTRVTVNNNQVFNNNTRGFNKWWEAGGMKFVGGTAALQDSRVSNNGVYGNNGDGIWFDWGNARNLLQGNTVAYNKGSGIHYEVSSFGTITDNRVFGNTQRGIYLMHSRDTQVLHNLVAFNRLQGLAVMDEGQTDPRGLLDLRARRNVLAANIVAWNTDLAEVLPGAQHGNRADANVFVSNAGDVGYSMGWVSLKNPRMSLSTWRSRYAQDLASVSVTSSPSAGISQAVANYRLDVDWAPLRTIASATVLPAAALTPTLLGATIGTTAGPRH